MQTNLMKEELVYKEVFNPELLQSMEIEVEIHKLRNMEYSTRIHPSSITHIFSYHLGTGDVLDDLLLGRQPDQIREYYVKDYTRGGKDRAEFEDFNSNVLEKTKHIASDVKGKLSQSISTIEDTIKGVFNMGREFLNS